MQNLDTISPETLIATAEKWAKEFKADELKTNQVRNFYSAINSIKLKFSIAEEGKGYETVRTELTMLKPHLAYAAGRQNAVKKHFEPNMKEAINAVQSSNDKEEAMNNFLLLMESVVAYFKFHGGGDK